MHAYEINRQIPAESILRTLSVLRDRVHHDFCDF